MSRNAAPTDAELVTRGGEPLPAGFAQAVAALESGMSVTATATYLGMDRRTVSRWAQDPRFQQLRREMQTELVRTATSRLGAAGLRAIALLTNVLEEPDARLDTRVRAADALLRHLSGYTVMAVMEERIAAVEAAQAVVRTATESLPPPPPEEAFL